MKIILASGSPRRRQLLEQVGLRGFVVRASDVDESVRPGLPPAEMVEELSARKAAVVALEGAVLGKPASPEEAARMLAALSGRTHQVYTGLTLAGPGAVRTEHEVTAVTFRALSGAEIAAYVATGEPMDKAGAYGIQGLGALLVQRLEGDYFNVMGLPLCRLGRMLRAFGVELLSPDGH